MSTPEEPEATNPLRAQPPLAQPRATIPRWLAWLVLAALLASGTCISWRVLTGAPIDTRPPAMTAD